MSTWLTDARPLFENTPSTVVAVDLDHCILGINAAGLEESGYRLDDLRGRSFSDLVPPNQRDGLRRFLSQATGGETVSFPIDAYSADGRLLQYEATALPIIEDERIVGAYALMKNVTERRRAERTVEAQREEILDLEHDFQSLFAHNPDGIAVLSTDGVILDLNEAAMRLTNLPREQKVGQHFSLFLQGTHLERGWNFFRRALAGETVRYEITSSRNGRSDLHLDATMFPKYAQGVVVAVYGVFKDITERKNVHRKLEMQAQRMRDLYLLATVPEYTEAQIISTLQTGCRLLGMESGAIVDCTGEMYVDTRYDSLELFADEDGRVIELAKTILGHRAPVAVAPSETGDSAYATWIGCRLSAGSEASGVLVFHSRMKREQPFEEVDLDTIALIGALVGSALERRRSRTHLRTLAYYDALTGLPNRVFFQERLRDAMIDQEGHVQRVAVLLFDLDRFKDINDTLGHAMGDRLLQMVAHRLTRVVGEDGLVARMGADEFIVLLRNIESKQYVEQMATAMSRAIEEPFRIDDYEQYITSSIGVAVSPGDGRDDQTLIKHADIAMYRLKDQGGNGHVFYEPSFEGSVRARLTHEKALRRAIEREHFLLHYQPIIDVESERIVSVEALLRWRHPERGLIYPDEFVPVAEASGLIVQLGEWVIANASAQVRRWQAHMPLAFAVNISARQFHHPDLPRRLLELLTETRLDPKQVEIEITESMALADVAQSVETVRKLKDMGMTIAVDDFGTGHSSLSYLRRFDVDHLKIDRSFVAGIGVEASDETIVKAIIAMGHSLGLTVVAEGVEKRRQFDFLRAHGCDRAQGYLFSRPLDAERLEELLSTWRGTGPAPG